jgi:hypothetical protein
VKDVTTLDHDEDAFGFLATRMIRGRNEVEARLRESIDAIDRYLTRMP